jgi:hypothetical protein
VNVSPAAQDLDHIQGHVTIRGAGFGSVTLNDQAAPVSDSYTLTASGFNRANFGGLNYSGIVSLTINAAPNNNPGSPQAIYVLGTPAGMATTINAANGWHNVVAGLPNGNALGVPGAPLNNILGPVTVNGQAYQDNLDLYDRASSDPRTYNMNANSISTSAVKGVTPGLISWQGSLSTVVVFGSVAADTYALQSAPTDLADIIAVGAYRTNTGQSNLPGRHTWLIFNNEVAETALQPGEYAVFENLWNFTGGPAGDDFQFTPNYGHEGGLNGVLYGNGGTLDYSNYHGNVLVDLPLGTATGVAGGVRNIRNVIGSASGNDILVGNGAGNRLTGGQGRNLLIAGSGAGTLVGGPDSDILVGGATPYDKNVAALDAVMAEWGRTDLPYNARVRHILSGGGLNGNVVLNGANVQYNGGGNTLDGGPGLDLFYGVLPGDGPKPDTTDWTPAQGEIFIEPNRERLGVQIDPTGLAASHLVLDYTQTFSTSAPVWLTLQPGSHVIADAAGTGAVNFTVNPDGTVGYAPALQGILTGQGTSQLGIRGAAVTIDATASSMAGVMVNYLIREATSAPFTLRLLPGTNVVTDAAGTGAVNFTVNPDGTVSYAPALQGILTGQGTNVLAIHGAAVTIDATALSAAGVMADYLIMEATSAPFTLRLLPGTHVVADAAGTGAVNFTVNPDGTVSYAPALQGILTGQGTHQLVVQGAAVTIDATALSTRSVMVNYLIRESTSAPFTLRLLPGTNVVTDATGTGAVNFTVNPDGTVSYASNLQGVLTGQGTHQLVVHGAAVTIDATALAPSTPRVYVDGILESTSTAFILRLLPGSHLIQDTSGHAVTFTVNPDGTISYASVLAGKLLGQGTTTLTVKSLS